MTIGALGIERSGFTRRHEGTRGSLGVSDAEHLATAAIDCAVKLHIRLGPGLLESAYELILCEMLKAKGFSVDRQVPITIDVDGIRIADAFRPDILINRTLLIELKSVERLNPVYGKQVLTYLRLLDLPLGLLMNFGQETLKDGLRRVINGPTSFVPSRLRVKQASPDFLQAADDD